MKKLILAALLVLSINTPTYAGADYTKAVIGHVITNSSEIDEKKLLEQEMSKLGHQYAIQMLAIMQQYLPSIIDSAMAEMRMNLDKQYKCKLLTDTKIADKECQ